MLKSVGLSTEINGAISATITMKPTSTMPIRDFGFESSRESHPGMRDRRARSPAATLSGTTSGGVSVGCSCDTSSEARTRGSRTKLSMSMMKFAAITQNANTSSSACVSG